MADADLTSSVGEIAITLNAQDKNAGAKLRTIKTANISYLDRDFKDEHVNLFMVCGTIFVFTVDDQTHVGIVKVNKIDGVVPSDNADLYTKLKAII